MQSNNSLIDFMTIGNPMVKLSNTSNAKERYIWATNDELRWSESFQSFSSYSKIEVSSIISVWTQDKPNSSLLIIETTIKTYKFQFKSPQTREKWHNGIKYLISGPEPAQVPPTRSIHRKNTILGENNQESNPKITQKQSFDEIIKIIKQYSKYCEKPNWDEGNLQNIPQYLEEVIIGCNNRKWEIQNETCKDEENNPKKLMNKIGMLRKKLKMMEIETQSSNQIDNLSLLVEKEKEQIFSLQNRIEDAMSDKNRALAEWTGLKTDLEKARELKSSLEKQPDLTKATSFEVICSVLKKGFFCYISTFASQEYIEPLTLTPRRGYEEGVYKKRQVRLSTDHKSLTWKAVGLFTKKTFSLILDDICTIVEGTEDCERFEPFANHKYISIIGKNITVMICIENYYGVYLDGIRELFLKSRGLINYGQDVNSLQILRLASEQLQNQISTYMRMFKRYKSSLVDSLCTLNCCGDEYQEFFYNEIQQLKGLNDNLPLGLMASDSENYLRNEKKVLSERINALDLFVASQRCGK